jgi:Flp pilus assembly protein TadD
MIKGSKSFEQQRTISGMSSFLELEGDARADFQDTSRLIMTKAKAKTRTQKTMTKAKQQLTATPTDIHQQGLGFYSAGRLEEALEKFKSVLEKDETSDRWNDWGAVQFALGSQDKAELGFRKALELDNANLQVAANLGSLLVGQHRFIEAAPFLLAALKTPDGELRSALEEVIAKFPKPRTTTGSPATAA